MEPCVPESLPLKSIDWATLVPLIASANAEVALYRGILKGIRNPQVFLSPLTTKEAVLSSRIEGTEATLAEVLEYEAAKKGDEKHDIREIINYRHALDLAVEYLDKRPICLNLLRQLHYVLLDSVRGRDKARGEFRKTQNYVGKPGSPIEEASFVPPAPDKLMQYLSNLEKYIHYNEKDKLVQLAVVHAQFEIIHPFLDGNGRLGRIIIPVFMVEKKLLDTPTFYISAYLEARRDEYGQRLHDITENNEWMEWITFFLTAVIEQAKENSQKARAVRDLYEDMKEQIASAIKSQYSVQVLDTVFERPYFDTMDFVSHSRIPRASAIRILNELKRQKIIEVLAKGKGRRPSMWVFRPLMDVVD